MPKRACDCHAHVFGPLSDFPMVPDRLYTPPEAPLSSYEHLLTTLGFERGVIVQPSVYGTDNHATLQAVASHPDRYRAVVVVDGNVTPEEIASFHQQGARGVRANLLFSGDKAMADVRAIARIIADFDWHLQVLLDVTTFPDVYAFFDGLPVEVVFDHMGHFPAEKTVNAPGCQEMLKLMEKGKAWTKLSGAYRTSAQAHAPYEDVTPIAQAIIQANPDQVVFGTDWPHPHFAKDMPNDGALLDQLPDWAPELGLRQRILVDNPARLYGF
jgi:predicted TIM-barrel fold metal-dependent hydrolase